MVIVRVRGIGVAVITSTSGAGSRAVSLARCATPNLCCSSITASPRFENEIDSYSKACVPTMIWGWSLASGVWGGHAWSVLVAAFCDDKLLRLEACEGGTPAPTPETRALPRSAFRENGSH